MEYQPAIWRTAAPVVTHCHRVKGRNMKSLVESGFQPSTLFRAGQYVTMALIPGSIIDLCHHVLKSGFVLVKAVVTGYGVHDMAKIAEISQQVDRAFV